MARVPRVEESDFSKTERIGGDRHGKKWLSWWFRARIVEHFPVGSVRAGVEQERGWVVNPDALLFLFSEPETAPGGLRCYGDHAMSSGNAPLLGAGSLSERAWRTLRCSSGFHDRSDDR